ncbi:fimbrial protein [Buttiauxella agrestis]|uniref:fimbrial protein n=1 Tax=Buttiauxella agrestis TaxID=82977 RepID=UPI003974B935
MNHTFFKKVTLASLVAASALVGSMAHAEDDSNILNLAVSGSISAPACKVALNKSALELGSPLMADLKTSDQEPTQTSVRTLQVAITDCESINAEVSVLGTADATDSTILANGAATDAATNVGIAMWNHDDSTQYKLGGDPIKTTVAIVGLDFGLVKSDATSTVTAGDVSTSAQIKVTFL